MTFREEQIGDCRLILADCREVLPTLGKVDAVVTDPPYEFEASGAGIFRSNRKCMDEIQANGLDKGFDCTFINSALCDSAIVFCHNDQLDVLLPHLKAQFGRFALCFWHKTNPMPVANKHYKPDTEIYIHAWNSNGFPAGTLDEKGRYYMAPTGQQSEFDHPTVKPLPLMRKIIRNTNGLIICDPYMGSGTTGVACVSERRHFIGIERNQKYFDIACRRIEEAYKQPDMFITAPEPKAVQPSMFDGDAA